MGATDGKDGPESDNASVPEPKRRAPLGEEHWSRVRKDANREALEHLRERSRAPGVASGGAERNHYCMQCHGVIPLRYDQRAPADDEAGTCPHCGAALDPRVRAMFNWVEIDQPPRSDRGLLWVLLGGAVLVVALVAWWW